MARYKLTIEYDGTGFYGWQIQARTGERTVQGELQRALSRLPGEHSSLRAAGRTDAGVHALAMVAHFDSNTRIPAQQLQRAINAHLPPDVRVLSLSETTPDFEAQYDCLYRRYIYRMRLTRHDLSGSALDRNRVLLLPQALNVPAMQAAAPYFLGTHDFAALATQETRSTIKTIYQCNLMTDGNNLTLHITGDGFLRNMVRAIVGTLILVGENKRRPEDITTILASKDRQQAGSNMPPQGLYFAEAGYQPWQSTRTNNSSV